MQIVQNSINTNSKMNAYVLSLTGATSEPLQIQKIVR